MEPHFKEYRFNEVLRGHFNIAYCFLLGVQHVGVCSRERESEVLCRAEDLVRGFRILALNMYMQIIMPHFANLDSGSIFRERQ